MLKASSPKLIAPLESVMLPSAKVKLPTVEPDAEDVVLENEPVPVTVKAPVAAVPVVLKASSPKLIAPLKSVMLPSAKVRLPTDEPDAAEIASEKVPVPVTLNEFAAVSNPLTPSVPPISVFPVEPATLNLFVLMAKLPAKFRSLSALMRPETSKFAMP